MKEPGLRSKAGFLASLLLAVSATQPVQAQDSGAESGEKSRNEESLDFYDDKKISLNMGVAFRLALLKGDLKKGDSFDWRSPATGRWTSVPIVEVSWEERTTQEEEPYAGVDENGEKIQKALCYDTEPALQDLVSGGEEEALKWKSIMESRYENLSWGVSMFFCVEAVPMRALTRETLLQNDLPSVLVDEYTALYPAGSTLPSRIMIGMSLTKSHDGPKIFPPPL